MNEFIVRAFNMGGSINNSVVGTANIADASITPPKLAICDFATTTATSGAGDITGATKTYSANELRVGDVIEFRGLFDLVTGGGTPDRAILSVGGQTANLATNGVAGDKTFVIGFVVLADATTAYVCSQYGMSATTEASQPAYNIWTTLTIPNITTNATIIKGVLSGSAPVCRGMSLNRLR